MCDTFLFRYSVHIEVAGFRVFVCLCDICVCWLMYDDGFMDNNHTYINICVDISFHARVIAKCKQF